MVPPGWRAELGITGMWLPRAERSFSSSEEPIVPRVRASLQYAQSYFAIGPLVGYGLNLADGHQDPYGSYDAVPFGIEVGGMLSVWLF